MSSYFSVYAYIMNNLSHPSYTTCFIAKNIFSCSSLHNMTDLHQKNSITCLKLLRIADEYRDHLICSGYFFICFYWLPCNIKKVLLCSRTQTNGSNAPSSRAEVNWSDWLKDLRVKAEMNKN